MFGFSDRDSEGDWEWITGEPIDYTNWCYADGKEQPNDGASRMDGKSEDYAEFYKDTADGTWNDATFGKNTYHFICEWE